MAEFYREDVSALGSGANQKLTQREFQCFSLIYFATLQPGSISLKTLAGMMFENRQDIKKAEMYTRGYIDQIKAKLGDGSIFVVEGNVGPQCYRSRDARNELMVRRNRENNQSGSS